VETREVMSVREGIPERLRKRGCARRDRSVKGRSTSRSISAHRAILSIAGTREQWVAAWHRRGRARIQRSSKVRGREEGLWLQDRHSSHGTAPALSLGARATTMLQPGAAVGSGPAAVEAVRVVASTGRRRGGGLEVAGDGEGRLLTQPPSR
jgi:hypothetical protein